MLETIAIITGSIILGLCAGILIYDYRVKKMKLKVRIIKDDD